MHHSLLPFLLFLLSLPITYTIYIPIPPPDIRRPERIESFQAQKPLPTSALLAGAASSSFPSPLPLGSHPLTATDPTSTDPKRKSITLFDDDIEDLKHEMDDLRTGMERLRGKIEDIKRRVGGDNEDEGRVGRDDDDK